MAAQLHQVAAEEALPPPPGPETPQPTLEQLIAHSRELLGDAADQVRDIGDLAFMELELAMAASKWWLLAVLLFCASSLLCFTFIIAALAVFLVDSARPAAMLLLCGGVNAIVAFAVFFWVKSLSRKMTFRNLRQQLSKE